MQISQREWKSNRHWFCRLDNVISKMPVEINHQVRCIAVLKRMVTRALYTHAHAKWHVNQSNQLNKQNRKKVRSFEESQEKTDLKEKKERKIMTLAATCRHIWCL